MNREIRFPTRDEIMKQSSLVKALVQKELVWESGGNLATNLIRIAIITFFFAALMAGGMRDEEFSNDWDELTVSTLSIIMGCVFLTITLGFGGSLGAETMRGTLRTLSLYPIGINSITSSKLIYITLIVGTGMMIFLATLFLPFWIMGIISARLFSYYMLNALLFILAYVIITSTGAFYANISASRSSTQMISNYSFMGFVAALLLSFWPVYIILTLIFRIFDPNDTFVSDETAKIIALAASRLSPLEMAYQFSRQYILGLTVDPSYLVCIPIWIAVAIYGIKHGRSVYMDVFFRRG